MASYVALANWTAQGLKNAGDTVARAERVRELATEMGGSVQSLHWCLGRYDIVLIADFPDNAVAAAYFLKVAREGNVITETLPAFTAEEVAAIVT